MPIRAPWFGVALAATMLAVVTASASQRSELLVAQGEAAYNTGHLDEARRRFSEAIAADPDDDAARAWLQVIESRVPGATARATRPESAAKWWDLEAGTGVQYDSNVGLDHTNRDASPGFLFSLSGHVDPFRNDQTLVRLDYDFFQVLNTDGQDFDVRSNRFRGTFSRAVASWLWLGLQGGYDHATLHSHAYLQMPWAMPYASIVEGDRGVTQILYRYGDLDFLGSPFGTPTLDRDGPAQSVGVNQILFFFERRLALTLGYSYWTTSPRHSSGDDFACRTQQGRLGLRVPSLWRTLLEFDYVYRYDDYTKPNSVVDYRKTRQDSGNYLATLIRRPIIPHLDALLSYYVTVNGSNISDFAYQRQIVALELRLTF